MSCRLFWNILRNKKWTIHSFILFNDFITIDYCAPTNPCANGGQCSSTSNNFVCDCTGTGYGGARCTYLIPNSEKLFLWYWWYVEHCHLICLDPCSSNPCLNGGQCSWDGSTMTCSCINGYQGAFCQVAPSKIRDEDESVLVHITMILS